RDFIAHQLIADLRAVAVHDAHAPAGERQLHDGPQALAGVAKLIVDRGLLARRRQRISPDRYNCGATVAMPRLWIAHGCLGLPSARPSSSNARPNAARSPRLSASRIVS